MLPAEIYRWETLDFLRESLFQPRPGEAPRALVPWPVCVPSETAMLIAECVEEFA